MSATAQLSKLAELRTKTDQDLVRIIDKALEVGLLIAATNTHVDRADKIHADTLMLLTMVEDVRERWRL